MKSTVKRRISLLLALMLLLSMTVCVPPKTEDDASTPFTSAQPEYSLPLEEGYNQVTFYWKHSGGH